MFNLSLISIPFSAKGKFVRSESGKDIRMLSYYSSLGIVHQTLC